MRRCAMPPCAGHTFGGIGGTHYHGGWQVDFEAAPMTAYVPRNPTRVRTRSHSRVLVHAASLGALGRDHAARLG